MSEFVSGRDLDDEVRRRRQRWPVTSLIELLRGTARALAASPRGQSEHRMDLAEVGLGPDGRIGVADLRLTASAAAFTVGDLAWRLLTGEGFDPARGADNEELTQLTRRAGPPLTQLLGELLNPDPKLRPKLRDTARRLDALRAQKPGPGLSAVVGLLQGAAPAVPMSRPPPSRPAQSQPATADWSQLPVQGAPSGSTEDWSVLPTEQPRAATADWSIIPAEPRPATADWSVIPSGQQSAGQSPLPAEPGSPSAPTPQRSGATTDWSLFPIDEQPKRTGATTDWSLLPIED